jgi:hypothetical protein
MLAVSAAELAAIQAEANSTLDKPATIWRDTTAGTTRDIYGSSSSDPANTGNYTQVAPTGNNTLFCSVAEPTATHLQNYDYLIGAEATWLVKLPVGTTCQERDHIVVESQVLEVHVILTPRSYAALLTVLAAEIK